MEYCFKRRSGILKNNFIPTSSWQGKLFKAVTLLFVAVFAVFIIGLILADIFYIDRKAMMTVLTAPFIRQSLWISIWTSSVATAISLLFAVPAGFALSRYRFPGRLLVDTIIDLPIVFPPFVVGLTLLIFFKEAAVGKFIQNNLGIEFIFQPKGIVLCQLFVAASFAVRFSKIAFDAVDVRGENVALTLGCNRWDSFRYVAVPQAANGIIAGGIITWARSFGTFGPLFVFVGSMRSSTEVLPSAIYSQQSAGNLEVAIAAALLAIFIAFVSLLTIRLVSRKVVPVI
jgi:molybdate transport system permease protein